MEIGVLALSSNSILDSTNSASSTFIVILDHFGHSVLFIQIMAVPHSVPYPSGGTWFDTLHKTFDDVPVQANNDNAIPTSDFLEAAESLTTLFGKPLPPELPSLRRGDPGLRMCRCARLNGIHTRQE